MFHIILSVDYEIYGSGSGDVLDQMIKPTEKLLKICDFFEVPMNIMFEVSEYKKFKEYDNELTKDLGYSPSKFIEWQVLSAYNKGHDIQLHTHPQWIDAHYTNNQWFLPQPHRSIMDLSVEQANSFLFESKKDLQDLIRKIDSNYRCTSMRLTNLPWVEAPSKAIESMNYSEIKIHSFSTSDSPNNNEKGYWALDSKNGVYELPVFSINMKKYRMYTLRRVFAALKMYTTGRASLSNSYDKNSKESDSISDFFKYTYPIKWDFSKQSSKDMIDFLDFAIKKYNFVDNEIPLVMIGHSKDFFYPKDFFNFLSTIRSNERYKNVVKFTTFTNFLKQI